MSGSGDSGAAAEIKLEARIVSDAKSADTVADSIADTVTKPMSESLDAVWGTWGSDSYGTNFASSLPSKSDIVAPLTYVSDQLKAGAELLQNAHAAFIQGEAEAAAYYKSLGEQV